MKKFICLSALSMMMAATVGMTRPAFAGAGDYPTLAITDYVLGCMQSNGQTRAAVEKCSCSIDVIASILPYDDYETAETFRAMAQTTGERAGLFKESPPAKASRIALKQAQAEADIRCF